MQPDSINPQLPRRQKNTAPGEQHLHHVGTLEAVEVGGDSVIVESNAHRLALPIDSTFVDVQREFFETFGVWINASTAVGETAEQWFDRLCTGAALTAIGGAA